MSAAIDEILGLTWPEMALETEAQAPVGGDNHIRVSPWLRSVAGKQLTKIDREDEDARLEFEAALEEGESKDALRKLVSKAKAVTEQTARKRAALAAPILSASDGFLAKKAKKTGSTVGWCANPALFGGCSGDDLTDTAGKELSADKKVAKALP